MGCCSSKSIPIDFFIEYSLYCSFIKLLKYSFSCIFLASLIGSPILNLCFFPFYELTFLASSGLLNYFSVFMLGPTSKSSSFGYCWKYCLLSRFPKFLCLYPGSYSSVNISDKDCVENLYNIQFCVAHLALSSFMSASSPI